MSGGFEVKSSKDSLNFFTMVVPANEIPFYLLEIDCPSEVKACFKQPASLLTRLFQEDISWDEWVYQPRNFLKLFVSSNSAFHTISAKTKLISERAFEKANEFQSQHPYLELPRIR